MNTRFAQLTMFIMISVCILHIIVIMRRVVIVVTMCRHCRLTHGDQRA